MSGLGCCAYATEVHTRPARRLIDVGKWIAPGAALLLIPKCPLCIVAYIAMITGIGVSMSTAQYLRSSLITAIVACVAYLLARAVLEKRRSFSKPS